MPAHTPPRVFTIPAGAPFLDGLVAALFDGRLIDGFDAADPFALADLTLYLPTRRAARAVRDSFLRQAGRPLLLPSIRTLGDIDEDDLGAELPAGLDMPDAIPSTERQLALTRLVLGWSGIMARAQAGLPDEELIIPSSPADAARLANSLGRLIDQVGSGPDAWAGLFSQIPSDLAQYWEITLDFLQIATAAWPQHLAARGLVDPGTHRDRLIRAQAQRYASAGSPAPVIAAGSTGSVPATATLLAAIARLPNGAVILPGLDGNLDKASWDAIGPSDADPAGAGHPQYGLKRLLEQLGIRREDVLPAAVAPLPLAARARLVSEALRPAATTELWSAGPGLPPATRQSALFGLAVVEAANEREEALAIATILRGAIEEPGAVAALVTPDRGLARRVAVELKRWAVEVDDSAGQPLKLTAAGVLARLVADAALGGAADTLLALAKHPLAAFGQAPAETRRAARALERAILRGPRLTPGLATVRAALARAAQARWSEGDGEKRGYGQASRGLSRQSWTAAEELAERMAAALQPLETLQDTAGTVPLAALVGAHRVALAAAMDSETAGADEASDALADAFDALAAAAPEGPDILPRDYPGLFAALIEGITVRRAGADPRIHIWGALEARLQSVDVAVLGGLNEGTWPGQTRLDPLLSRPMRTALDLEPPERRIGLAAHDFAQALGHPQVWLTRAERENDEPRVASRWLQRLLAYAGKDEAAAMRQRGAIALALGRQLDQPAAPDPPRRPRPSPAVEHRPKQLSVTRIETLIRDPYAVYAREILRLMPFEPLGKLPDAAERGNLIHDILERFVRERPAGPFDEAAAVRLLEIGREAFARHADFPEVIALWWPRFERIAAWFIREEASRQDVAERHVEGTGVIAVTPEFSLTARADRIDRLADGTIAIIDYKTGQPPGLDQVLSLSPQLPLEGLIARAGGFEGVMAAEPSALLYYRLTGRGEGGLVCDCSSREASKTKPAVTLPEALARTETRLRELAAAYALPEAGYLSRTIPRRDTRPGRTYSGDYDHLARVAEWATFEEELDE